GDVNLRPQNTRMPRYAKYPSDTDSELTSRRRREYSSHAFHQACERHPLALVPTDEDAHVTRHLRYGAHRHRQACTGEAEHGDLVIPQRWGGVSCMVCRYLSCCC